MKRLLSLALLGAVALGTALAQQPTPAPGEQSPADAPQAAQQQQQQQQRGPNPGRQLAMLTKRLNLSADQQTQLRPILEDRASQMQAIRNDVSLGRRDRRDKMQSLRSDSTQKLEAVLTADQKQTYETMMQQAKAHHHNKKNNQNS